jgi:hypothetical protein
MDTLFHIVSLVNGSLEFFPIDINKFYCPAKNLYLFF